MFSTSMAVRRALTAAAIPALVAVATACSSKESTEQSSSVTGSTTSVPATTEPTSSDVSTSSDLPTTSNTPTTEPSTSPPADDDEQVVNLARSLCEAYGDVDQPGGVDQLLALLSDDVVLTDTVLGASLTGIDQVRAYLTSEAFASIDTAQCGATVQRGSWVAGAYTLSNGSTGAGGQGIAAIHVTDGKVDQQINYYTPVAGDAAMPGSEPVTESVVLDYCHAWDDGADQDAVAALVTPDAELNVMVPIVGVDAIREFAAAFPFDRNDCGAVAVEHGSWGAVDNAFLNSTTGESYEGVNVVEIVDGKIARHFVHLDAALSWTGP